MDIEFKSEGNTGVSSPKVVNLRCPICNHIGAFHGAPEVRDYFWHQGEMKDGKRAINQYLGGIRICPNTVCLAVMFIIYNPTKVLKSFPPQTLNFDATNLPPQIKSSLTEAVRCHSAACFKASALMVRRTLEELCADKNAVGGDLKARLKALGQNILVPQELLDAADELRLLGNDAAHIDAKSYDAIGEAEARLAIELSKELLKSTYQYGSLVDQLKALKKSAATP